MRTTSVVKGEEPFKFNTGSDYQCTWYAFYELLKRTGYKPCYWDRATKSGSYTNGKKWLDNYREPFMPIRNFDKMPDANDVIVFTGNYGHVVVYEGNNKITDYNRVNPLQFDIANWDKGQILKGNPYNTGKPIGYLHLPQTKPVQRDPSREQIKVNTLSQHLRDNPNGNIISYCFDGYFNVLETKVDNFIWHRIDKDTWIALVDGNVEYLPISEQKPEVDYKALYDESQERLAKAKQLAKEIINL